MSLRDLETELVGEKPWTLKGEVSGKDRPRDAVLEEVIEFPRRRVELSEDLTLGLEEDETIKETGVEDYLVKLIKERVAMKLFDNVEKRVMASGAEEGNIETEEPLNFSKSKTSLLEQYKGGKSIDSIAEKTKAAEDVVLKKWDSIRIVLDSFASGYHIAKPVTQ